MISSEIRNYFAKLWGSRMPGDFILIATWRYVDLFDEEMTVNSARCRIESSPLLDDLCVLFVIATDVFLFFSLSLSLSEEN